MPRWYAARPCTGKPESFTQQVSALVRGHHLGRTIPLIRFEKRPGRGGFYAFLAIESETPGVLPPELAQLQQHSIFKDLLPAGNGSAIEPFTLDRIEKMVTGEIGFQDYARRLVVQRADPDFVDPFPAGDTGDDDAVSDMLANSDRYDRLMVWMSAEGSGTLTVFQRACDALGLTREAAEPGRVLRRLRLLGHVEASADGVRWSVAPTVLTAVTGLDGAPAHVLCGARDYRLLAELHRRASVEVRPQPGGDGPARIEIACDDPEQLAGQLQAAGLAPHIRVDDAAARLAEALPPLTGWKDLLRALPNIKLELYDTRRFQGDSFVSQPVTGSGFYELWPPDGRTARCPDYRLYYDAPHNRWLSGDWYGLRYLALIEDGADCRISFDLLSGRLAIPWNQRPPELYERALVLCSGRLPRRGGDWLYYDDVTHPVLGALSAHLSLTLREEAQYA